MPGCSTAVLRSASSRSTMGWGVPAGVISANQPVYSKPGTPASATVGTSGSSGERSLPVTASARRRSPLSKE